jgi:2-octaprenyl-3-methyl-6-methoxy-1,4-benzoquinol hydroxylase
LVDSLWQAAMAEPAIELVYPDKIKAIETAGETVSVSLQSGIQFTACFAIGADGAGSKVRSLLGIESDVHDYRQKGLVAFVETELPHRNTAWQRFLSTGPLAFLPFGEKVCSIVWSLPEAKADELLAIEPEKFSHALDSAFAGTLGKTRLISDRVAFPLKRQLAKTMMPGRTLLLGDAAHAVHPLAGQGVNLGLRDVSALATVFEKAIAKTGDALDMRQLQRWARERYSENAMAALTFENINRVFSNDNSALSLTRGYVLGLADKLGPLKNAMARYAAGI